MVHVKRYRSTSPPIPVTKDRSSLTTSMGGIGEIGPAPRSRYRSRRPHAGRLAPAPSIAGRDALASSIRAPSVTRVPTSLRGNRCAPAQAGVSSTNAEVRNCSGNSLPTAPEPFPAWGCEPMSALSIRSAAVCPSQGKGGSRSRRPSEKYWNRRPAGPSMQGGQVHSSYKAVLRAKITDSSPPKRATKFPRAARR